jgi:hypothetical protein
LEVALNVDDESGCDCGEQTGLYAQKNQMNTATGVTVKEILTKIKVVFKSPSYLFIKSRSYSSAHTGAYRRIRSESCWGFEEGSERDMAIS